MEVSGGRSWRASIGAGTPPAHQALFIRDSCKLAVPWDAANPPRLIGEVADHSAELPDASLTDTGSEWLSWWHDVVGYDVRENPAPRTRHEAQEQSLAEHVAHQALFDWPALSALQSRPALQRAAQVSGGDARRVRHAAKLAVTQQLENRQVPRPIAVDPRPIAEALIERLAISPDRLNAVIEVLGVAGDWSYQPAPCVLLCSMAVAQDAGKIAPLIEATFLSAVDTA